MIKRECKGDLRMKLPKDNQMNVYVCMWKNAVNEGYLAFWLGIRPLSMPMGPRRIGVGTEENVYFCLSPCYTFSSTSLIILKTLIP